MNKFRAKSVRTDEGFFGSQVEYRRWCELKLLEKAGHISDLRAHPRFEMFVNGVKIGAYTPDSSYVEDGTHIAEDVKSHATRRGEAYRLRVKLCAALFPNVTFREEIR